MLPDGAHKLMPLVAWLALGNLVYCGWVAMRQRDFSWLWIRADADREASCWRPEKIRALCRASCGVADAARWSAQTDAAGSLACAWQFGLLRLGGHEAKGF